MSKREFIRKYRAEIDEHARKVMGQPGARFNDSDREQWISNDENWYNRARRAGVKL